MDEVLDVQFAAPLRVMFPSKSPATCRASSSAQKDRMTVVITTATCSAAPTTKMTCSSWPMSPTYQKARSWLGSNEMKSVMEKSGVVGSPSTRFAAAA
jgi:hypothetical protein